LAWVSVVVVEVAGVAGVVEVVVLVVVAGVEQPVSDARAATAKQERMNFFISIILVLMVN
jgi:NhaP-type Na+/H+ or K+/H+ antiporter